MEAFSVVRQIWFGETFSFLAKPDLSITIVVYIYVYIHIHICIPEQAVAWIFLDDDRVEVLRT